MNTVQSKLLEMLIWIDRYCRDNGLTYYCLGGTMLGIIRHQGFIPWDDDIDIGLPRNDYDKLMDLIGGKEQGHYYLETVKSINRDYCYPYAKLYDMRTTLIENYNPPLKRGVFIDVFPLDCIGNNYVESKRRYRRIAWKYKFYLSRVAKTNSRRAWYKNAAITFAHMIPNRIIDNQRLRISLDADCSNYKADDYSWVGNLLGNWGLKEIMPKSFFGTPTEYCFEGYTVYGVQDYQNYLTAIYGNWRELPPPEQRISHHDYLKVDLENSYI